MPSALPSGLVASSVLCQSLMLFMSALSVMNMLGKRLEAVSISLETGIAVYNKRLCHLQLKDVAALKFVFIPSATICAIFRKTVSTFYLILISN